MGIYIRWVDENAANSRSEGGWTRPESKATALEIVTVHEHVE
jgi:hypothetical protein